MSGWPRTAKRPWFASSAFAFGGTINRTMKPRTNSSPAPTTRFFDSIVPISKHAARWSPTVKNWRRCAASDSHSGENRNDENEPLRRRNLFASLLPGFAAVLTSLAEAAPVVPDRAKVVYHLSDLDKVNFVLGNIKNHFDGMGGPERVTIALVVHGPALKAFYSASANP